MVSCKKGGGVPCPFSHGPYPFEKRGLGKMTGFFRRFLKLIFGLFLYAVGIVLTINAHVGYGPWDVFHVGLGRALGITLGTASIITGFVIVAATYLMKETLGIGTILNMFLIGIFIDVIMHGELIPVMDRTIPGVIMLLAGMYVIALATYFYIGSGFGTGPRDGLMVALTRRSRLPVGLVRGLIEVSAIAFGWFLGGMVGIGTVIYGLLIGFCIQSTFRLLHFDPTKISHESILESCRGLKVSLGERGA